jgi:uncharacterized membrane protein YeaQ/YmgE (transglycosylase-associated protein family)
MDIIAWIFIGLVEGLLASMLMRDSGFGLVGDIALGIGGACVAGWTLMELGWRTPLAALVGLIVVAAIGGAIVLTGLRLRKRATARRSRS